MIGICTKKDLAIYACTYITIKILFSLATFYRYNYRYITYQLSEYGYAQKVYTLKRYTHCTRKQLFVAIVTFWGICLVSFVSISYMGG